ncbi:MAG: hypothetical protein PHX04_01155 [Bacilli bacterium]|nr:hypothetical protein [Bacilli bacterium]
MGNGNDTVHSSSSYDVDNPGPDTVSQTNYHSNGSVHQYDSKDGDWGTHGHSVYDSGKDHYNGNSSYDRSVDDPKSEGRSWNDRRMFLEFFSELSFAELQQIESLSTNEYVKRSARHFMQSNCGNDMNRGLGL